jgi:MFS transporter, putative metabolite transport protein
MDDARQSVQDYIDELPRWADGTSLGYAPMTAMQWRIWSLAAAGKFFEGFVVFMTGVALPLVAREFNVAPALSGFVSAATLLGILVGAIALGGLADFFGRKRMFVVEMIVFVVFLCLVTSSTTALVMVLGLFGLGLALGCDYPTAHMIISENTPTSDRGRLVLGAFAFQAIGALFGTAIGFVVLSHTPTIDAWRWMYATALIPALIVAIGRFYITESANWLLARGEIAPAERAVARLLVRKPQYPHGITLACRAQHLVARARGVHLGRLFARGHNLRATIFASVPWFLQDLSTYGIGIFTPTILAIAFGAPPDYIRSTGDLITQDILAAKGSALTTSLLIAGVLVAVVLSDRVGRIKLQIAGFVGCAVGLLLAALSSNLAGDARVLFIFAGFMLFNFMTNVGPNSQTYLLAGEVFPTEIRAMGAGFAAGFAKVGAVLTAFFFPILLNVIGTSALLSWLIAASLLGALVTWLFRIETTGVRLDRIGSDEVPHQELVAVPVADLAKGPA